MSAPLLPQTFWFRLSVPCRRLDALPRSKGRMLDLPESCRLPQTALLDGRDAWADVRLAWNPKGLAVAVEVTGKTGRIRHLPDRPEVSDGVDLWIDTRDTRNVHRATRFCHRLRASIIPQGREKTLDVAVAPLKIHRAQADAPLASPDLFQAAAEQLKAGWRLELFLPAETLNGFDPETNRRLGFAYQVTDPGRGDQFLGVGREFPVAEDPSLWSTLELRDDA
ncbi:MAG: hypothetical protein ABI353_19725 [Isosphaeraceae bacterium]